MGFDSGPGWPLPAKPAVARRMSWAILGWLFGRIAQRESARFTRGRSLVRSQVRPLVNKRFRRVPSPACVPIGESIGEYSRIERQTAQA